MEANIAVLCKGDIKYLVTVLIQQEKRKQKQNKCHTSGWILAVTTCAQLYISSGPGADN